jgi:hypothetical protein
LIDGASPGPQMLAALTVNKAVDGLPLNRTQKRFARCGVDLPIQTLNRWEGFAHQLLLPLIERLRTHVQQADTINLDDTGLRVLQAKKKGGSFKGHIWVFADNLTADGRLALRKQHSVPVLQQMHERAQALSLLPLCKPMKIGVTYLLNQYSKLIVPFTEDGRLEIDNGSAERHLRRVASGRKAWLFAGSERGANRFAGTLSLVSSAEAAGLDPGTYIADVLTKISHWPNKRLGDLLPHRYKALCQQAA